MGTEHSKKSLYERSKDIHGDRYDYSKTTFGRMHDPDVIMCKDHGPFQRTMSDHIYRKVGCPLCGNEKTGDARRFDRDTFISKSKQIFGNVYDYSLVEYKNMHTKVIIGCNEHGTWTVRPKDHLYDHSGCPSCSDKESFPEKRIAAWLKRSGVTFLKQYKFPDCRNINLLIFDFFVPSNNILIEYDGQQHFKPPGFVPEHIRHQVFKTTQMCDVIKTEYATEKGIRLLRIPYTEEDNIEQILTEEFNKM